MTISLTGKHVVLDETLRHYIDRKVEKLAQHGAKLHDVRVMLAIEKYRAQADVSMNVDGHSVTAKAETTELYESIDGVMEKIERQLTRYRAKRLGSQTRRADVPSETPTSGNGDASNPLRVSTRTVSVASMSTEDALVTMGSLEDNCMIFSDERVGRLRVIHRRPDGEVEIMDPLTEG